MSEKLEWKRGAPVLSGHFLVRRIGGSWREHYTSWVRVKDRGDGPYTVVELGDGKVFFSDIEEDAEWFKQHEFADITELP